MKTLLSALIVLAMVSPLSATVFFQEDFEGGAPGTDLTTLGWTGPANSMVLSSNVVDVGQSMAPVPGVVWPVLGGKTFSPSQGAGDTYVLTATFYTPSSDNSQKVQLSLYDQSNPYGMGPQALRINAGNYAHPNYGIHFEQWDGADSNPMIDDGPVVTTPRDIMAILKPTETDCYWRVHGTIPWNFAGTMAFDNVAAHYDAVYMTGGNGTGTLVGGMDSIRLSNEVPVITLVPEPSTIVLLSAGLIGLLAYAWRKRK